MYRYNAIVDRVVDGDTVDLSVDLGFRIWRADRFRLYGPDPSKPAGLNAPELRTPEGKAAKEFLCSVLKPGMEVIVETLKDRQEKYGRYLAVIYFVDGTGRNVAEEMIKSGHAELKVY